MGNYDISLAAGTYHATAISAGAYETAGGALMLGVQWLIDNAAQNTITSRTCLISKAGVVMEKQIKSIREWAPGWDGINTEWFADHYHEFDVNLVIERRVDSYDNTEKPEVAFINPIGSAVRGAIPNADQKAIGAKFGAKLRALAGTMPKPPAANPPAKVPTAAEKKTAAWNAFKAKCPGDDNTINAAWVDLVATAVPGKTDYAAFTIADWDAVIKAVDAFIPDDMPF